MLFAKSAWAEIVDCDPSARSYDIGRKNCRKELAPSACVNNGMEKEGARGPKRTILATASSRTVLLKPSCVIGRYSRVHCHGPSGELCPRRPSGLLRLRSRRCLPTVEDMAHVGADENPDVLVVKNVHRYRRLKHPGAHLITKHDVFEVLAFNIKNGRTFKYSALTGRVSERTLHPASIRRLRHCQRHEFVNDFSVPRGVGRTKFM